MHDISRLRRVSTYARSIGISHTHVYRLIESGDIQGVEIDGVKFVKVEVQSE